MPAKQHEIKVKIDPRDIPGWYGGMHCKCHGNAIAGKGDHDITMVALTIA